MIISFIAIFLVFRESVAFLWYVIFKSENPYPCMFEIAIAFFLGLVFVAKNHFHWWFLSVMGVIVLIIELWA